MPVLTCTCKHDWQDRRYGQGRRVHNVTKQGGDAKNRGHRCTVCGNEKTPLEKKK